MSDEPLTDDQSHYEISLTAGQAFVAFVLLLLSLAASFAFGLMIGKGQADERLVVRKEPAIINEGSVVAKKDRNDGRIVELPVTSDDFKTAATKTDTTVTATPATTAPAIVTETTPTTTPTTSTATATAPPPPGFDAQALAHVKLPPNVPRPPATPAQPAYAQLLSTENQKTAEALAAKLIDGGFTGAYVERGGNAFKVRVKFPSEADARNAEGKLKTFSKDVWIVK